MNPKTFHKKLKSFLEIRAHRALAHFRGKLSGIAPTRKHGLNRPLIVSLTSYPKRFPSLHQTLNCLLSQTVKPDQVILWVTERDYLQLPDRVKQLQKQGLTIQTTKDDTRSYKKIIPALEQDPNRYIVTVDDDLYYPSTLVEKLVDVAKEHPTAVIANRTHKIETDPVNNNPKPYHEWHWLDYDNKHPEFNFLTGVGGVLYPPNCFHSDVTNKDLFMKLAPHADDVWLYWMLRMNQKVVINSGYEVKDISWPGSQDSALWKANTVAESGNCNNDTQFKNLWGYYQRNPVVSAPSQAISA